MNRTSVALLAALQAASAAGGFPWYPLEPGHRWVYDCMSKSGDRRHPDVSQWTAAITVRERIPTSEGVVVIRSVSLTGDPNPPGGWPSDSRPLLERGNCVYLLYPELWNPQRRAFTPNFAELIRQVSPQFCAPLHPGATWKGTGDWAWTVDGMGPAAEGPQDVPADAIRLLSHQSGTTAYVWFREGVGPVASWNWHNGAYTEGFERLRP